MLLFIKDKKKSFLIALGQGFCSKQFMFYYESNKKYNFFCLKFYVETRFRCLRAHLLRSLFCLIKQILEQGRHCSPFMLFLSKKILLTTRGARNPNLQVVITYAPHVCSQHSFGLSPRMNGMHTTQFDHAGLDLLSLVI